MVMPAAFLASALIQFALGLVVAWLLGPAEFGFYALALAGAVLIQTLAFEWLRLGATRFHHAGAGAAFKTSLIRHLAIISGGLLAASLALAVSGGDRHLLLALVPMTAIAAGYADLRAAMLRSEFESHRYALFLALRNGMAMVALPAAAVIFGRAEAALGAFLLSLIVASAVLEGWLRLQPRSATPSVGEVPAMRGMAAYSLPVVATNLAYLGLFFLIRVAIAWAGGIAVSGQASLALDFTLKLFTTAGTAFDLLFFQLAVRDERERGAVAGQVRVRQNFERLLVLIAPMALGLAFVLHRIEPLLVAPEFRGAFAGFVFAAIPGVVGYALIQYGLHPAFQLRKDTARLLVAASVAGLSGGVVLVGVLLMHGSAQFALGGAMIAAMAGAIMVLLGRLRFEFLPDARFWVRLAVALGVMGLCLWGTDRLGAGYGVLAAMLAAGVASYALTAWLADLGNIRALLRGVK